MIKRFGHFDQSDYLIEVNGNKNSDNKKRAEIGHHFSPLNIPVAVSLKYQRSLLDLQIM
jgi:hypothetical protein